MYFDDHQDIPPLFCSDYSEEPFDTCIDCHRELTDDVMYVIQKHYVSGETVFEMALCLECNQTLNDRMSEESRQAIHKFLEDRAADVQQTTPASNAESIEDAKDVEVVEVEDDAWIIEFPSAPRADDFMQKCAYCGTSREDCHRHAISGLFRGKSVVVQNVAQFNLHWPMLICEKCVEATNELISKKTRDEWNRFVEHNFDGPPGLEVDWPTQQPVLI